MQLSIRIVEIWKYNPVHRLYIRFLGVEGRVGRTVEEMKKKIDDGSKKIILIGN